MTTTADLLAALRATTAADERARFSAALARPVPSPGAGTGPPGSPTE